jgi:hypothetical protein
METMYKEKKTSFFSRFINRIKSSALFDIFFNSDAGRVWTEKDTEAFVSKSISDAFKNAGKNIGDLLDTSKTSTASKDPFGRLDPKSLTSSIPPTRGKRRVTPGRDEREQV